MKAVFSWSNLKKGFLVLAPMSGITNMPFRIICKEMGADVVFNEFVNVSAIRHGNAATMKMLRLDEKEKPIIAQLFGSNIEDYSYSSKLLQELGFDGIDLNMGCPAKKVVAHSSGASLLNDQKKALNIIETVRKSVSIPVSVKTRLGYNKNLEIDFYSSLFNAGADIVTIHARTYKQGFHGDADYNRLQYIIESVKKPIIGNGDVVDVDSYRRLMKTGCIGVMIGRGVLGNPWLFRELKGNFEPVSLEQKISLVLKHAKLVSEFDSRGIIEFRKHLGWYFKGIEGVKKLRAKLMQVLTYADIENILSKFKKYAESR